MTNETDLLNTSGIPLIRARVAPIPAPRMVPEIEGWDPAAPHAKPLTDLGRAAQELSPALLERLVTLSRTPQLLIATDYDGTIAPIVKVPSQAYPLPASVIAMRALATLPSTEVAVISGRSLRDLAAMSRLPIEVQLIGSHGSEFDIDTVSGLPAALIDQLDSLKRDIAGVAAEHPGVRLEDKPAGLAVHVRGLEPAERTAALDAVMALAERDGVFATAGKEVVDFSVVKTSKGAALRALRARLGSSAALYIGDDTSDERALATLQGPDLGIKVVGEDEEPLTSASVTVPDPATVSLVLATLFDLRRAWLFGRSAVPIERHSLLANGQSTALVDPEARICWMPHPLPHSASMFSEILGTEAAGFFAIAAQDGSKALLQRYVPGSTTVETRFPGFKVTDYLAPSSGYVTTLVRVVEGYLPAKVTFAPRLDYGTATTRLELVENGVRVLGTSEPVVLRAPGVEFEIHADGESDTAVALLPMTDTPVVFTLSCGGSVEDGAPVTASLNIVPSANGVAGSRSDQAAESARRAAVLAESESRQRAEEYWTAWAEGLDIANYKRDSVLRSAITLRALCHRPTGGVLAAATSSLPEGIGGVRNWDYRYCWLRDGSMTVNTLLSLGSTDEAVGFLDWLGRILDRSNGPEQLHPLYAVDGSGLSTEAVLDSLPGYAGSRPVRVGNAAEHQVQLDVFGPITELLDDLTARLGVLSDEHWFLTEQMVTAVERRWMDADHGIWEARRAPRHHVYTKVMCWVTVDRALRIAERYDRTPTGDWERLRKEIADDVLTHGWSDAANSYTVAYGSDDLDAAILHIGLSGLLPPDDPRFEATVEAIERELRVGPTVFRYRYDDGLPGLEGGFHICTTWLIEAFLLTGRVDDARQLFERLTSLMGPTGLLPEEYDPVPERHLGNHPQAYSHLGYIRCAQRLAALSPR